MKKLTNNLVNLTLVVALITVGFSVNAQNFTGDTFQQAQQNKRAKVTFTYVETPGFVYKNDQGRLTGVCVEIMDDFRKYVYNQYGIEVNARFVGNGSSFQSMYQGAKNGSNGVFGLGNITVTEARKSEIQFSPSFITNFAILVTHSSVPTLESKADIASVFKGFTAYTAKGTLNEKRVMNLRQEYIPNAEVSYAGSSPEVLDKVLSDKKSFSYLDLTFYLDALNNRKPLKRHEVGDEGQEEFAFIMPLNSDWKPVMDEFFAANGGYKNSADYKRILVDHLGLNAVRLLDSVGN